MKLKTFTLLTWLVALFIFHPHVTDAQTVEVVPFERPNVIAFQLTSEYVEHVMLVEVALPISYSAGNTYPVMYFTDGLIHFPLLTSSNFLLSLGDETFSPAWIPEVISVGIDFVVPLDELDRTRLEYFTPTETVDEDFGLIGGGADRFLDFMRYELKPFIDATFQADTEQELFAGHSLGGLLSLYTLFTQPDLFEKFIAASPSAYWDEEVIYDFEQAYFASGPTELETLYMTVGTAEDPFGITLDYVLRLARQIRNHQYPNMTFGRRAFRGHNHSSVVAPAYASGARFVFSH